MTAWQLRPAAVDVLAGRASRALSPPGFRAGSDKHAGTPSVMIPGSGIERERQTSELKLKKSWDLAKSPSGQIVSQLIMSYMSGSGVHIFSIMITFFMLWNPLKAILNTNNVFAQYETPGVSLAQQKLVYLCINLAVVAIGVYKLWVMGLLPNSDADWIHYLPVKRPIETAVGFT